MGSNTASTNWRVSIASGAVAILAVLLIFAVLTHKNLPLISGDKAAFITLFIIGFSMSLLAGIRDNPGGTFQMPGWTSILLMVLGFLAVVLLILMLVGVKIPMIPGYREVFVALTIIVALKWLFVHLYNLIVLSKF